MTTNLIGTLADPLELSRPPPDIRLPPNASLSQNPQANADPSYMRSTVNSIPTTSALLNKSKLPFALVLTPHRSIQEGDVRHLIFLIYIPMAETRKDLGSGSCHLRQCYCSLSPVPVIHQPVCPVHRRRQSLEVCYVQHVQ